MWTDLERSVADQELSIWHRSQIAASRVVRELLRGDLTEAALSQAEQAAREERNRSRVRWVHLVRGEMHSVAGAWNWPRRR